MTSPKHVTYRFRPAVRISSRTVGVRSHPCHILLAHNTLVLATTKDNDKNSKVSSGTVDSEDSGPHLLTNNPDNEAETS